MLSEPKSKQRNSNEIYEFMVLNHVLSSNIASLSANIFNQQSQYSKEILVPLNKSINILNQSLHQLDSDASKEDIAQITTLHTNKYKSDNVIPEQLNFIYKVSCDIGKITDKIAKKNIVTI